MIHSVHDLLYAEAKLRIIAGKVESRFTVQLIISSRTLEAINVARSCP